MNHLLNFVYQLPEAPPTPDANPFVLRHFRYPEDVAAWLLLRQRAFARQRVAPAHWNTEDFHRELSSRSWWAPQRTWVIQAPESAAGELAGSVTLAERDSAAGPRGVMLWLIVDPRWRRQGVGRHLAAQLHYAAWQSGYREIWLETHPGWTAAIRLYEQLGYRRVE